MNKAEIRKTYLAKRKAISAAEKDKLEDLLLIQFQRLPVYIPTAIMSYTPIEKFNEFDPQIITDYCKFKQPEQLLIYPIMHFETQSLRAAMVAEDTLFETNAYGVDEPIEGKPVDPADIDMILIPLLAFDLQGYRVGYGKGYYDRFLQDCRKDVIRIGFSFFEPVDTISDVGTHDVRLDFCVTPERYYSF